MNMLSKISVSVVLALTSGICAADMPENTTLEIDFSTVEAVHSVMPKFPAQAVRHQRGGSVEVQYSVNELGRAEDIRITNADAGARFVLAVKRALAHTEFAVSTRQGKAVKIEGQQRNYSFEVINGTSERHGEVLISMK